MSYSDARVSFDAHASDVPPAARQSVADRTTNLAGQLKAVGRAPVLPENVSGTTAERPQAEILVTAVIRVGYIIITAIDRFLYDMTNLVVIAHSCDVNQGTIRRVGP